MKVTVSHISSVSPQSDTDVGSGDFSYTQQ